MAVILNIETSTSICSVALTENGKVIADKHNSGEKSHASHLTILIEEILAEQGFTPEKLTAVAVGKGPGSYTGLRIGISTAKGIAWALGIPLIAIDTLLCLVSGLRFDHPESFLSPATLLCPMLDARRMEVYTALFDTGLNRLTDIKAEIINENSFSDLLTSHTLIFFGDGMQKCRNIIQHKNAIFVDHIHPLARYLAELSYKQFLENKFEDVAYFEPFYLKDFIATIPKNMLKMDKL